MSKLSRTKGHSYEREIAREFKEMGFPTAERQLEYQISEAFGVDLKNTDPFLVQCKRGRKWASISKIKEIKRAFEQYIPLLITKGDREESVVCMYLRDFKELVKTNQNKGEGK